jgi:hypothetical protein
MFVVLDRETDHPVSRFREARQLRNGGFVNMNLSAEGIDRLCRRILDVGGVSEIEWNAETK